jgi:hypothetical protein
MSTKTRKETIKDVVGNAVFTSNIDKKSLEALLINMKNYDSFEATLTQSVAGAYTLSNVKSRIKGLSPSIAEDQVGITNLQFINEEVGEEVIAFPANKVKCFVSSADIDGEFTSGIFSMGRFDNDNVKIGNLNSMTQVYQRGFKLDIEIRVYND